MHVYACKQGRKWLRKEVAFLLGGLSLIHLSQAWRSRTILHSDGKPKLYKITCKSCSAIQSQLSTCCTNLAAQSSMMHSQRSLTGSASFRCCFRSPSGAETRKCALRCQNGDWSRATRSSGVATRRATAAWKLRESPAFPASDQRTRRRRSGERLRSRGLSFRSEARARRLVLSGKRLGFCLP